MILLEAGITRDEDGTVRVPYRLVDGPLFREKLFVGTRSFWGLGDGIVPFGLETLAPREQRPESSLLIAEGESDALAIRSALCEWRGRRLDVLGLPGASTWRAEWEDHRVGYERFYVCPDRDTAGDAMLHRVGRREQPWLVKPLAVRSIVLPAGEDARSVLQSADGLKRFTDRMRDADRIFAEMLALRLGDTPEQWVEQMLRMRDAGVWG